MLLNNMGSNKYVITDIYVRDSKTLPSY